MPRRSSYAILFATLLLMVSLSPIGLNVTAKSSDPNILLVFTGDIMPDRRVEEMCEVYDDPYLPYYGIDNFTTRGDITCGNLETSASEKGTPSPIKKFNFQIEPKKLSYIKEAGFDVLSLANNHILDYGPDAALDTGDNIEEYGMQYMGLWYLNDPAGSGRIPRAAIVEKKGVTFAFLGYSEYSHGDFQATNTTVGPCPIDMDLMRTDIEYAKGVADVVIVSLHWFYDEYDKTANENEINTCRAVCDLGANILANHGHHVLQEVEYYNGSLIMHCLGNTVFDQSFRSTHKSALALVHMKGTKLDSLELVPLRKNDKHQYIPQGNILEEDIVEGLYLDWTDFEDRMFNSEEFLTDYEGAQPLWYEPFLTAPVIVTVLVSALFLVLIMVAILVWRLRKRKTRNKS